MGGPGADGSLVRLGPQASILDELSGFGRLPAQASSSTSKTSHTPFWPTYEDIPRFPRDSPFLRLPALAGLRMSVGITVHIRHGRFVTCRNLGIKLEEKGPNFLALRCYTAQLFGISGSFPGMPANTEAR